MLLGYWRVFSPCLPARYSKNGICQCKAEAVEPRHVSGGRQSKKKVVIVGSGWAGLGAAHHLSKQGFDVTLLEDGNDSACPDEIGIRGFWYPYRNIFRLVGELGIKPFTNWTKSAQYSREGLEEVEFPIFQDLPQLPAPLGTFFYTRFIRLPLVDQLTSLPLMAAAIDFDNTDSAWRKYDSVTARELLKQFGCSERLYRDVFAPLLQVGLFAPAEQCSAASTLGMLYFFILAHQNNFDMIWCRGTVREKIFEPWIVSLRNSGCEVLQHREVTDFSFNKETGSISEVVCGKARHDADAVILAIGISAIQNIVKSSTALRARGEFLKALNLSGVDVLTVKLWLDRKVNIPIATNACSGFDDSSGWTFFDLNAIHDEYKDNPETVIQADFYHANELLLLEDEQIVTRVVCCISKCIEDLKNATVIDKEVRRFPKLLTHFFPGSYKYMMRGSTSFPNLFMAGDWIITRHGSWSQEKSYVTGLEAANRVVDYLEEGSFAKIVPLEEDEPHIQMLRSLNRNLKEITSRLPWSDYFLQ